MNVPVSLSVSDYWDNRRSVAGAFWDIDFRLFDELLAAQESTGVTNDLLEIGALYGKSAIVLGVHARADEIVHICDVFEQEVGSSANRSENRSSYPGLARATFEANYGTYVKKAPRVIQELSTSIGSHVTPGSVRFAHIDGGHLFETVVEDLLNVKPLLRPDGIIVMDDVRAPHTPGVAAAVWAEVVSGGLVPFALSEQKLYATWGAAADYSQRLDAWLARSTDIDNYGYQEVAGHSVLIVANLQRPTTLAGSVARRVLGPLLLPNGPGPHLGSRVRNG